MKRKLAMMLCAVMVLGSLAGCGSEPKKEVETDAGKTGSQSAGVGETLDAGEANSLQSVSGGITATSGTTLENVSYVMIYNPYLYDESGSMGFEDPAIQSTGDMSSQIIVGMNKAGGLEPEFELPNMKSQAEINADVDTTGVNREGVRAGAMDPSYNLYDRQDFYHSDIATNTNVKETFECVYVGSSCYIWDLNGSITEADAQMMGQEFDTMIYQQCIDNFGKARFTENGGKINLLFYPMEEGLGGYFTTRDIFSSAEVPEDYIEQYGFNLDHAIVHINSDNVLANPAYAKSTMAHEFQHLICASECFYYVDTPWMATWLNESMSAFAEELVYPGIKEAGYYNQLMYLSDNFRRGQSLYNFDTMFDDYIGAYGAVYLFSEYLTQLTGENAFSVVHMIWANSFDANITEADAVFATLPAEMRDVVNNKYTYSSTISAGFDNFAEEYMSKITLDFFIETLSPELANLVEYADGMHASMLYSEIGPVDIEGGGRIVVATQNGRYQIPADADTNLVYIGLDANFEPVSMVMAQ